MKFRPGAAADARAGAHRAAGATLLNEITRTRVQRVRVRAGDEADAIARYQRNPDVLYAEPNFVTQHTRGNRTIIGARHASSRLTLRRTVGHEQHRAIVLLHPVDRR